MKLYGIWLTEPGIGKYLGRWGLSFQRAGKRAVEQEPEAVREWLERSSPGSESIHGTMPIGPVMASSRQRVNFLNQRSLIGVRT
ncbi:winged helix-turn-helix domain-containing protein [Streptomyces netropsis]|uniref:winged helix-turn-helix domain-containing protein n=1 Tax=Streptomyces netropsis TaxID=55404 RepID=UPI0037AC89ED